MTPIIAIAEMANHATKEPWPSLETASWLFDRASFALIASLVVGAIATTLIVWMGIVKEHHWDLARDASNLRIAELNKDTAKISLEAESARADIANANERAALAEQKAAEANLALAKITTPRSLTAEQRQHLVESLKTFSKTPFDFFITPDPEPVNLMGVLADLLTEAGWEWKSVGGIIVFQQQGKPNAGMMTGSGVGIQIDHSKLADWEKPVLALANGLAAAGIETKAEQLLDGIVDTNAIHIRIGKKP
jgi:hypothetical protein